MSNVVDSSAWLEYLADGANAGAFAPTIEAVHLLVVPTLVITEVLRRLEVQGRSRITPDVLAQMRQATIVPLNDQLAVDAATIGKRRGLALADSIIYATTQAVGGTLWTQDEDFRELPSVEFRRHAPR